MATTAQVEIASRTCSRTCFTPEFELLLICSGPTSCDHCLRQALEWRIDWDRVLRLAEHHRVLPALHCSLAGRQDVPASIQSAIRSRFQNNALKALRFSAELARVATLFRDAEIGFLAHKGPALAQMLYSESALRQFGDLDVLVRPDDVPRAAQALRQRGYQQHLKLSPRQEKAYLRCGYEYVFGLKEEPNLLEVQWQVLPRFYSVEFDFEGMFERSIELRLHGLQVRSLCYEDLMLVLCVHAAKHGWAQLGMLRDIATLTGFPLDWRWVQAEAVRLGILRIVAISLLLARMLLGSFLPPGFDSEDKKHVEKLAKIMQYRLVAATEPDTQSVRYFCDFLQTRERWHDRIRLASRLAFTPSVEEWSSARIPDSLFALYRALRLARLAARIFRS